MRNLAKAFLIILLAGTSVTLAEETTTLEKCNFAPTSKITNTPTGLVFRSGSQVQFSGTTSTPNNCSGSITEYRWKIEGVYSYSSTKSHTFTLPAGVHEQTYSVELRVRNNINLYNTKTITVTVKRPQRVYHLKDHIGNVRTSVDVDGNVLGHDDYYAFGLSMPGAHSSNTSNPNDNYKFTGYERDNEAGLTLYHANARTMDPVIGRFMQVDPRYDKYPGNSVFNYALNNPLYYTDPGGDTVRVYIETSGVGHAWISAGEGENKTIFSFGRYAGTNGTSSGSNSNSGINSLSDGPGVLLRLTGEDAEQYNSDKAETTGYTVFNIADVEDDDVLNILNSLFESSSTKPEKGKYANSENARVIGDYSLFKKNCTTVVCSTINEAGSNALLNIFGNKMNIVQPGSLKEKLEKGDSTVIDRKKEVNNE